MARKAGQIVTNDRFADASAFSVTYQSGEWTISEIASGSATAAKRNEVLVAS